MESVDERDRSWEPMDIDISANSANLMEVSFSKFLNNATTQLKQENGTHTDVEEASVENFETNEKKIVTSHIKKYHIKIQSRSHTPLVSEKITVGIVLAIAISIISYHMFEIKCSELNLEYLKASFKEKVYGQTTAINDLIQVLEYESMSKLLFLSGGTGVGKTLTASIILESAGYSSNIYHYTMPSFVDSIATDLLIGMTFCGMSVFIVDDLNIDDTQAKSNIKELFMKSDSLNKNTTIILIYNCDKTIEGFSKKCDENFHLNLMDMYKDVPVFKKIIKFEPLREEHLIKCIENELGRKVTQSNADQFLKMFNVSSDGCKGVHTKMKISNIV